MPATVQPAIVGATGYAGFELARLLLRHPQVRKPALFTREGEVGVPAQLDQVYPHLSGNGGYPLQSFSWEALRNQGVDVLFLATPHEVSREWTPEALRQGMQVVDLSGAWRAGWLLGAAAPDRLARALGAPVPGPGRVLRCASDPSLLLAGGTAGMPFSALLLGARAEVDAAATSLEAAGAHPGTESDAAAARVLAGWPTLGREVDDKTLPQEARFDEIGGVSYTKGCYTGQETVARVHFRGHVNRTLRGLVFEGNRPPPERGGG